MTGICRVFNPCRFVNTRVVWKTNNQKANSKEENLCNVDQRTLTSHEQNESRIGRCDRLRINERSDSNVFEFLPWTRNSRSVILTFRNELKFRNHHFDDLEFPGNLSSHSSWPFNPLQFQNRVLYSSCLAHFKVSLLLLITEWIVSVNWLILTDSLVDIQHMLNSWRRVDVLEVQVVSPFKWKMISSLDISWEYGESKITKVIHDLFLFLISQVHLKYRNSSRSRFKECSFQCAS
jgi:hypothetical protein